MGGKFSQAKGKREELGLCTDLRHWGYTEVCRIAHWDRGRHNPDVQGKCPKTGLLTTFENKARKHLPRWLNGLRSSPTKDVHHEVLRFSFKGLLVAFGSNPLKSGEIHDVVFESSEDPKLFAKVRSLYKNLDGADFLVMKGSRGKRIYIKFWGAWNEEKVSKA